MLAGGEGGTSPETAWTAYEGEGRGGRVRKAKEEEEESRRECRGEASPAVPVWWREWWTGILSPAASWTVGCGSLWDSPGASVPV